MAHPDLNRLFDQLVTFAKQMLEKNGEFFPFGALIGNDDQVHLWAADDGTEQPKSNALIEMLVGVFQVRARAGTIQAAGICLDVRVTPSGDTKKTDAIQCRLEHANGEAVNVFVPYTRHLLQSIHYGKVFATKGESAIFGDASGYTIQ